MLNSKTSRIGVKDIVEELREENKRLLNELLIARKSIELLEKYRNNSKDFYNKCKCDENLDNKIVFNELENEYKSVYEKRVKKVEQNVKPIDFNVKKRTIINHNINNYAKRLNNIKMTQKIIIEIQNKKNKIKSKEDIMNKITERDDNFSPIISGECDSNFSKFESKQQNNYCAECELTFYGHKQLISHIKHNHNDSYDQLSGKFKCNWNECQYESERFRDLTIHKLRHSGDKPFRCDWPGCDAAFYRNNSLVVHRSSHEGLKKFRCDWPECGQKFRSKINLKNHYLIHTNEKPYTCAWPGCEAKFRSKSSINRHKLVHKGGADYSCDWPQCGKSFRFKGSLKRHIISHEGVKPFGCEWNGCESRFVTKRQMLDHFGRRHNKQTIV